MIFNRKYNHRASKTVCTSAVITLCIAILISPCYAQGHSNGGKNGGGKQPPMKFIVGPIIQRPDGNQGKGGDKSGGGRPQDGGGQGPH